MKLSDVRTILHLSRCGKFNETWRELVAKLVKDKAVKLKMAENPPNRWSTYGDHMRPAARIVAEHFSKWLEEDYTACEFCRIPHPEGLIETRNDDQTVCDTCYANRYSRCYSCDEKYDSSNMYGYDGEQYCESCYNDSFRDCDDCGRTCPRDDLSNGMCSSCGGDGGIHDYSTDVTEIFDRKWLSAPGEATDEHGNSRSKTPTLWLGFELEVTVRDGLRAGTEAMTTVLAERGILKDDGSIEGDGFEIVSLPGTITYHQTEWGDKFFETLVDHCRGWTEKSCGMHVHMSRAALTQLQLGRLTCFINHEDNKEFIAKVAGRYEAGYSQIRKKKITSVKRTIWDRRTVGAEGMGYSGSGETDRRQAVNLAKPDTVEIRIFQSNVSRVGFLKNLEFCHGLAIYCQTASNTMLNQQGFLAWMEDRRGAYPNFTQWAVREALMARKHKPKPDSAEVSVAA